MNKFNLKSEAQREVLDWGTFGWLSHPPLTGSRKLMVTDVEVLPGKGHDFHKHPQQEEMIIVVEGVVEQWIEQEKRILKPGDSAFMDADVIHASFNVGETPARLIAVLSPCVGEIGYELVDVSDQAPWADLR